jgi:Arc/MetJ family transcription regulator
MVMCLLASDCDDNRSHDVYIVLQLYTPVNPMRTNIVIDDGLMRDALKATGLKTKKEAVELGLKTLVKLSRQSAIKNFRGKLAWEGNLRESRSLRR